MTCVRMRPRPTRSSSVRYCCTRYVERSVTPVVHVTLSAVKSFGRQELRQSRAHAVTGVKSNGRDNRGSSKTHVKDTNPSQKSKLDATLETLNSYRTSRIGWAYAWLSEWSRSLLPQVLDWFVKSTNDMSHCQSVRECYARVHE
jgi:hypothetical protein